MRAIRRSNPARWDGTPRNSAQARVLGLVLAIGLIVPVWAGAAELVYSRLANRSSSVGLDGTTLDGVIYVSVSGAPGSGDVDFFVDDPGQSAPPSRSDGRKPFDLIGGSKHSADGWDLGALAPGPHTVTAVVRTKKRSDTVHATFNVAVPQAENLPPSIQSIPAQSAAEGEYLSFVVVASDPDSGPPSLQATNLPAGATFSPGVDGTGEFRWTPGFLAAGAHSATFKATDADDSSLVDTLTVSIVVADTNRPPSLRPVGPQTVEAGQVLSVNVSGTDPDGTSPVLAATSLPSGALLTNTGNGTGRLDWAPGDGDVGGYTVRLTAIDANDPNLTDGSDVTITVTAAPVEETNLPPSIQSIPAQSAAEGEYLSFVVVASDPDSGPPSLQATNLPAGATFSPGVDGTGEFRWTPGFLAAGAHSATFKATDADDSSLVDTLTVSIAVADTNRPPSLSPVGPQTVEAGQVLSANVSATDPDGTSPVLAATSLPSGALLTNTGNGTGRLEWAPGDGDVGGYTVRLTAIDANDPNLTDGSDVTITVTAAPVEETNLPPSIQSISSKTTAEGQTLVFTISGADPDNGPPTLSAANVPPGATFTLLGGGSAEFSWAAGYDAAGSYAVTFTATDAEDPALVASTSVGISVTDTNRPPSLTPISSQSVEAGQTLSVNVSATDPDGVAPVLSIQSLPTGAMFTDNGNGTGALVWGAADTDVGSHSLGVVARDATDPALSDSQQMLIAVTEAPEQPLAPVTVVWDPHPQTIAGYKVFYGPSAETALIQISELRIDAGDISAADPAVTYDPEADLGLQAGDPACFRVSAFNDVIESPLSQAACM